MWLSHSRWCALLHLWEKLIKPAILCLSRGKKCRWILSDRTRLSPSPRRGDRGGHWRRIMYRVQLIHIHFPQLRFPRFLHRPPESSTLAKRGAPRRLPNSQTASVVWYQMSQWEGTFLSTSTNYLPWPQRKISFHAYVVLYFSDGWNEWKSENLTSILRVFCCEVFIVNPSNTSRLNRLQCVFWKHQRLRGRVLEKKGPADY